MVSFDSSVGSLYLVFGNKEDVYDLPSLARLRSRDRYLYFCLKKSGYQSVLYWTQTQQFSTQEDDAASAETAKKLQRLGGRSRWFSGDKLSDEEEILLRFKRLLGQTKTALIAPADDFCALFRDPGSKELLGDMKELLRKNSGKSGRGVLLLTFPTDMSECAGLLAAEDSVLRAISKGTNEAAAERTVEANLYEALKQKLGDCCVFLNDLNRESIRNTVQRVIMLEPEKTALKEDAVEYADQLTELLFRLCRSRNLRRDFACKLQANPAGEMSKLDTLLRSSSFCEEAEKWIHRQKDAAVFTEELNQKYGTDVEKTPCPVYDPEDSILRFWEEAQSIADEGTERKIREIRGAFLSILSRGDRGLHSEDADQLKNCTQSVRKSVKALSETQEAAGKRAAFEKLNDKLELIAGWVKHYYDDDEKSRAERRAWTICSSAMAWIDELGSAGEKRDEMNRELSKLEEELKAARKQGLALAESGMDPRLATRISDLTVRINDVKKRLSDWDKRCDLLSRGIAECRSIAAKGQYNGEDNDVFESYQYQIGRPGK